MRKKRQKIDFLNRFRLSYTNKDRVRKGLVLASIFLLFLCLAYLSVQAKTYDTMSLVNLDLEQDSWQAEEDLRPTDELTDEAPPNSPDEQASPEAQGSQSDETTLETGEESSGAVTEENASADAQAPDEESQKRGKNEETFMTAAEGASSEEEILQTNSADSADEAAKEDSEASDEKLSGEKQENEKTDDDPNIPADPSEAGEDALEDAGKESSQDTVEEKDKPEAQSEKASPFALSVLGYDLDFLNDPNPLAPASGSAAFSSSGRNWPHIRTFGILYDDKALMDPEETAWIAEHYDMVMSGTVGKEKAYDLLKAANPDIKLVGYTVVDPTACAYMEQWCIDRGIDPEKLYYHYTVDTTVNLRQFDSNGKLKTITVPGYPNGSATTVAESRVMETWGARNPSVCPTSPVLREAYTAFVMEQRLTVNESQGKYLDGFIWDTYDSIIDYTFDLQLQNTHEMQHLGFTDADTVRSRASDDLAILRSELEGALAAKAGKPVSVIPNAAEDERVHGSTFRPAYEDKFGGDYDEIMIEYLTNTLRTRVIDSKYYMDVYDAMENGMQYFINSETNVFKKEDLGRPLTDQQWEDFRQFTVATQYLLLHPNGYFSYHQGSASIYQGTPKGTVRNSHWNVNYEFDPGSPVVRSEPDAWGNTGTDRFYVIEEKGVDYRVLAREFDNCLVIAKFGSDSGGLSPMGTQPATYQLGGEYRRLMPDNSYGPVITEITLCKGGGAILVRRAVADAADGGYVPSNPGSSGGSGDSDSDDPDFGIISKQEKPVESMEASLPSQTDELAAEDIPQTGDGASFYTHAWFLLIASMLILAYPLRFAVRKRTHIDSE